ncbi:hypothetical protein MPL3365_140074 [Mesorhizobium plurifarium]|uniref:Uncharacterized protein n=1 Tax=Mesorhizobium plurifarium TaxID=69974 RepID=A0A090G458_MESPL|nr:hypothetical protein MPL3365_140074 [Mesorhizobium plurifarium]
MRANAPKLPQRPTRRSIEQDEGREKQHLRRLVRRAPPDGPLLFATYRPIITREGTGAAFARIVPDGSNASSEDEHENPLPHLVLDRRLCGFDAVPVPVRHFPADRTDTLQPVRV